MANVIIKLKIMPEGVDTNLKVLAGKIEQLIKKFGGMETRITEEPIAFGLNALIFIFLMDEKKGDTEPLEKEITAVKGVESAEVIDVRRAFG